MKRFPERFSSSASWRSVASTLVIAVALSPIAQAQDASRASDSEKLLTITRVESSVTSPQNDFTFVSVEFHLAKDIYVPSSLEQELTLPPGTERGSVRFRQLRPAIRRNKGHGKMAAGDWVADFKIKTFKQAPLGRHAFSGRLNLSKAPEGRAVFDGTLLITPPIPSVPRNRGSQIGDGLMTAWMMLWYPVLSLACRSGGCDF